MGGVCGHQNHIHSAKSPGHKNRFSYLSLDPMKFNIIFENLKLQYPTKSCHFVLTLAGEKLWETPNHIDLDGKHCWKKKIETQIQATILELHEKKFELHLLEDQVELAQLSIPCYDIISGPQCFDYAIGKGRIQFDMQMAQIIQVEIIPSDIDCTFTDSIKDKAYVFNLRLVTRKMYFTSPNSENFYNPAYLRGFNSSLNNFLQDMMYRTTWNASQEQPILNIELPSNELYNSSLQVCIWSINKVNEWGSPQICSIKSLKEKPEHEVIIDQNLFGETFIALHKLIQENDEEDFQQYKQFKTTVTKSLWCKGNKVGTLTSKFNVKLPKFFKQKLVGMRTENGCTLGTNISSSKTVAQISQIVNVFQKLCELIFNIQSLSHNDPHKTTLLHQALALADQLLVEVQKSDKETNSKLFYYKHAEDLFKAQETFIKISDHLTRYVDKLDVNLREKYYEILLVVICRGEFRLHSLGYFEECKSLCKKQLELKNQVNLHYQEFMQSTLNLVLAKISINALQYNERRFIMRFLVIAFNRFAQFRHQFLKCLIKKNDPVLFEWRGTEFSLEEQDVFVNEQIAMIFDWQTYFYNYLTLPQNYQNLNFSADDEWKQTLSQRSLVFQYFLIDFCSHIQNILQKSVIPWQHVPGYKGLLKAFLCELKMKEAFTASFLDCVTAIATNTSLINIIVMILFNKTNIYQSEQVIQVLDLISLILQQCPQTVTIFDYPFFLNGLRIILTQSEHAICIATALQLIYTNFLKFPMEFQKALVELLFEPICYKLFLHWSKTVRTVFISFLLYRICHQFRNNKIQIADEEEFEQQYFLASKPKKIFSFYENRKEEKQLIADFIYMKYTRFMMNIEEVKQQLKMFPNHRDLSALDRLKDKLSTRNQLEPLNIIIQSSCKQDEVMNNEEMPSEKRIIFERRNEYRNPTRKKTIIIEDGQYKYLERALEEFADLSKQYTKWRQLSMNSGQEGMSPEERSQAYLSYQVPILKVLLHFDQKEGKQD